jgi:hypothetical protein
MSNGQFISMLPGQLKSTSANPFFSLDPLVYNGMSSGGAIETAQSRIYPNSTPENSQQLDHAAIPSGSRYGNPIQPPLLDEDADGHGSASAGYPLFSPDQLIYATYPTASDQQHPGGPVSSTQSSANLFFTNTATVADPFQCTAATHLISSLAYTTLFIAL